MKTKRILAVAIAIALVSSVPVLAAKRRAVPATFRISAPAAGAYHGIVDVRWKWTGGSAMRSRYAAFSTVDPAGAIKIMTLAEAMWHGRYRWDTTRWADGVYDLRGIVVSTSMVHTVPGIMVDNTAPVIAITNPKQNSTWVSIADLIETGALPTSNVPATLVVGKARFIAQATDNLSGIGSVRWVLDGVEIGTGNEATYEFGPVPAEHTVVATATDRAGNETSTEMSFHSVGAKDATKVPPDVPSPFPPEPPSATPPGSGLPVPSELPSLPATPPGLPSGTPSLPAAPGVPGVPGAPSPAGEPSPPVQPPLAVPPVPLPLL
ncbi:MAG: hypothetical protein HY775_07860 [Acidobacteria bacterium]|nr:hypothetical protein [Acidobacteriota bacterium]